MNYYVSNLFSIPSLIWTFIFNTKRQSDFIQEPILNNIEHYKITNDGSLSQTDFHKIKTYYGNYVTSILGEAFCLLRGTKMTPKERFALSYLGSLTGLFDDFFDEKDTPLDHIKQMIDEPQNCIPRNSHEELFLYFYNKACKYVVDITVFKDACHKIYDCQIMSKKQVGGDMHSDEIKYITLEKGGKSILFYRSAFGSVNTEEMEILHSLGGVLQLENDIFDIYKDYKANINTLVVRTTKIQNIRNLYLSLKNNLYQLINLTSYKSSHKKKFIRYISILIARGLVCLDCLERNESKTRNRFEVDKYSREDLICDMESFPNIIMLLHYYCKIAR